MNNQKEMKINLGVCTCQPGIGHFCKLSINLCRSHRVGNLESKLAAVWNAPLAIADKRK